MRDLDDDGALTEEEWAELEWASKASKADLNRDRKLTQPEKPYDTNGDGNTMLMEIEKVLSERRDKIGYSDRDAADVERLILRHDQNRDKVIRESELKEESGSGFLGKEILPQADRNSDGSIDQDELARYLARERS